MHITVLRMLHQKKSQIAAVSMPKYCSMYFMVLHALFTQRRIASELKYAVLFIFIYVLYVIANPHERMH
jgi:hypothetical protein